MGQYDLAQIIEKGRDAFEARQRERFGERYAAYRTLWYTPWKDLGPELEFPLYITIETAFSCNLKCVSCIHGEHCQDIEAEMAAKYDQGIMPRHILDAILEQAAKYRLPSIGLNWLGEPTLARDIAERIKLCVDAGIMDVLMTTNATMLTADLARRVIAAGLTHLLFSVDAATPETYALVRKGGNWDTVNANIRRFRDIRQEMTGGVMPRTRASLVPSRHNVHEARAFVEAFKDVVDYVEIQPFYKVYDRLDPIIPPGAVNKPMVCEEVFKKLTIDSKGDVHPCCSIYGRNIVLGNVLTDDLRDIFVNSPLLRQIRADVRAGAYSHKECKACGQSFFVVKLPEGGEVKA